MFMSKHQQKGEIALLWALGCTLGKLVGCSTVGWAESPGTRC